MKTMRRPIQVLVYPVKLTCGEPEYLLLRRIPDRYGVWQGVTGAPEESETLEQGAKRELLEETGLIPHVLKRIDFSYSYPLKDEWRHMYHSDVNKIVEYVFVAYVKDQTQPTIDPTEHDNWRWYKFIEAMEVLYWPENKVALERCHEVVLKWFNS